MNNQAPATRWRVLSCSVTGATHIRMGIHNQDDVGYYYLQSEDPQMLVVAVSDGHGSAKSFRSHLGSQFAVDAAKVMFTDASRYLKKGTLARDGSGQFDLTALKRAAESELPQVLTRIWQNTVDQHVASNPFTQEEKETLLRREPPSAVEIVRKNKRLAYGATLLVVAIIGDALICMQIGDGDVVAVTGTGEPERLVPKDMRLIANETTSLSNPNAWSDFQSSFHNIADAPPTMIFLSSDGYSNSFETDEGFLSAGPDIIAEISENGFDAVEKKIEYWLKETSRLGSGDDMSLALICREDAFEKVAADPTPFHRAPRGYMPGTTSGKLVTRVLSPDELPHQADTQAKTTDAPADARGQGHGSGTGGGGAR